MNRKSSPGRTRLIGALLIASALAPALFSAWTFADWLPTDVKRYEAYTAAKPCPAPDCLQDLTFTVGSTVVKSAGRSTRYEATLDRDGSPTRHRKVRFGDSEPLLERLQPGDRVVGTVWRGDIVAIAQDGVRQPTSDEPRDEPQITAAFGTGAGLFAALLLGLGLVRLARPRHRAPYTWRGFGRPLAVLLAIVCVALGFSAFWTGLPWWTVPTATTAILTYTAWQVARYRIRGRVQGRAQGRVTPESP